jgi:membrane fusion protein, multidrug efflux system
MSELNRPAPSIETATPGEEPSRGGLTPRKLIILAVLVVLVVLIAWRLKTGRAEEQALLDQAASQANLPVPVQVSSVQQQTVPVALTALGTVTAYNTVTLNSRVSGQIVKVNFREGQNVRAGELLVQIDPRPYQAALDQAIGQLAKDQANLKNTQAEEQRYNALFQAGVVSRESQQLQESNAGQAVGAIAGDKAQIESARVNLAYCSITSPIDGVVGLRQVDPGNIVNAGQSTGLVVITQVHPIAVIFTLPEDQLPQVQRAMRTQGHPLTVEAYDRADAHLISTGQLLTIDNQIDTTTGTAKLKAVFDNKDNALFANQFVNVRLVLSQRGNATVVPAAAVSSGTQGQFVFVVNSGLTPDSKRRNLPTALQQALANGEKNLGSYHVDMVPVHVDYPLGTTSVLSDGALKQGQQLVVDGQEKLVDGSMVAPQRAVTGGAGK